MSYLLWQRGGDRAIASGRRVLRAAEVPLCQDAMALQARLSALLQTEQQRLHEAQAQARAEGHAHGLAEGRAQAQAEAAARLLELTQQARRTREQLQADLVPLALQVMRKLVGQMAPDAVLAALATTALAEVLPSATVSLWVSPGEHAAVQARLAGQWPGEVRADPDAAAGTCRLETEFGSVDAALAVQLAQVERLAAAASA